MKAGSPSHPVGIGCDDIGDDEVVARLGEPVECLMA